MRVWGFGRRGPGLVMGFQRLANKLPPLQTLRVTTGARADGFVGQQLGGAQRNAADPGP